MDKILAKDAGTKPPQRSVSSAGAASGADSGPTPQRKSAPRMLLAKPKLTATQKRRALKPAKVSKPAG